MRAKSTAAVAVAMGGIGALVFTGSHRRRLAHCPRQNCEELDFAGMALDLLRRAKTHC